MLEYIEGVILGFAVEDVLECTRRIYEPETVAVCLVVDMRGVAYIISLRRYHILFFVNYFWKEKRWLNKFFSMDIL